MICDCGGGGVGGGSGGVMPPCTPLPPLGAAAPEDIRIKRVGKAY